MLKSKAPSPLPPLIITIALLTVGYFWFSRPKPTPIAPRPKPSTPLATSPAAPQTAFPPPTSLPTGTQIRIDGSTSMVTINQNLKNAFEQQFPGSQVILQWNGSSQGITNLLTQKVDIAAVSRPLTTQETTRNLKAIPVAQDAIALVVGINNPWKGNLTKAQAQAIFTGKITNWSALGGPNQPIRILNRPSVSGTRQVFQEKVLQGSNFGTSPNFTTLDRDATTPMLQALGTDGIGYATYAQIANQEIVRSPLINNLKPDAPAYPYQRTLLYVYKAPANPAVQAFLGYTLSPAGQKAIFNE